MRFIAQLIGNGVGLWLATLLVGGIHMTPTATTGQTVLAFAVVALVLCAGFIPLLKAMPGPVRH